MKSNILVTFVLQTFLFDIFLLSIVQAISNSDKLMSGEDTPPIANTTVITAISDAVSPANNNIFQASLVESPSQSKFLDSKQGKKLDDIHNNLNNEDKKL